MVHSRGHGSKTLQTADRAADLADDEAGASYLQAPNDFDVIGAFPDGPRSWISVASERLARNVLGTRLRRAFVDDAFWISVFRWLIAHPMLDSIHHGPIIDYLHNQRFVATAPNPGAHLPGQPRLVPLQPNLTIKDRAPEALLQAIVEWHQSLAALNAPRKLGGPGAAKRDRVVSLRGS